MPMMKDKGKPAYWVDEKPKKKKSSKKKEPEEGI